MFHCFFLAIKGIIGEILHVNIYTMKTMYIFVSGLNIKSHELLKSILFQQYNKIKYLVSNGLVLK